MSDPGRPGVRAHTRSTAVQSESPVQGSDAHEDPRRSVMQCCSQYEIPRHKQVLQDTDSN